MGVWPHGVYVGVHARACVGVLLLLLEGYTLAALPRTQAHMHVKTRAHACTHTALALAEGLIACLVLGSAC